MAQYYTDFGDGEVGLAPAGWVDVTGALTTFAVNAGADFTGGKALRIENSTFNNNARGCRWNLVPSSADVEILCRLRSPADGYGVNSGIYLFARTTSSSTSDGYKQTERTNFDGTARIEDAAGNTLANDEGVAADWTDASGVFDVSEWAWMRFRLNGTALKAKWWLERSGSEPTSWLLETTNSSVARNGAVGMALLARRTTLEIDVFAVGTDGDSAPASGSPPPPGPSTPINLAISDLRDASVRLQWEQG